MISNLEYYRNFYWVANLHNFTKASEKLCVSQSAVSQSIKKLEAEIGCPLFDRSGKDLKLTLEGERLFLHVRRAIEEFEVGENQVSQLSSLRTGELQIGATETTIRYFLGPWLKSFKKENPSIRITFKGATTSELCSLLNEGTIEIAFLISPIPQGYNFNLELIDEVADIPVVSKDFDINTKPEYSPSELLKYPLITVSEENAVRDVLNKWFWQDNAMLIPDFTVSNMGLVLPLVKDGLGIGILPEVYVKEELKKGSIVQLKTRNLPQKRMLYAATSPGISLSATGKAFLSHCAKSIKV